MAPVHMQKERERERLTGWVCLWVDRPSCHCWLSMKHWPEWQRAPVWGTLSTLTKQIQWIAPFVSNVLHSIKVKKKGARGRERGGGEGGSVFTECSQLNVKEVILGPKKTQMLPGSWEERQPSCLRPHTYAAVYQFTHSAETANKPLFDNTCTRTTVWHSVWELRERRQTTYRWIVSFQGFLYLAQMFDCCPACLCNLARHLKGSSKKD